MKIGVVKEIKDKENRVALTPEGAKKLVDAGHKVLVEERAGINSGFSNDEYKNTGAQIVDTQIAWSADLVVKVKEPMEQEYKFLKNQICNLTPKRKKFKKFKTDKNVEQTKEIIYHEFKLMKNKQRCTVCSNTSNYICKECYENGKKVYLCRVRNCSLVFHNPEIKLIK